MKKILIIIGILLILASIPVTLLLIKQRQELRKGAIPATALSLSPSSITKEINQIFTLEIKVDTGENQVSAAELYITFDPNKLEGQQISVGTFLPNVLVLGSVNQISGIASITLGSSPTEPKQGAGTVAIVSFKTLSATGTTQVSFGTNTQIAGVGETGNVLVGTAPSMVTISGGVSPSPTPTPTPTPTPSLTPTPTPSPTPGVSPSPTPTPSPGTGGPTTSITDTTITSPPAGATVTTSKPTISGKTVSGATVTITINSPTITATVTANSVGNWSYTPTTILADGSHTVTITAKDPSTGQTTTKTSSFIIAAGGGQAATAGGQIVAGNPLPTLFLLGTSLFLLFLSLAPKIL